MMLNEIYTDRLILKPITPKVIHQQFERKTKIEILDYFNFNESTYEKYKLMHEKGMETYNQSLYFFLLILKGTSNVIGEGGFHTWNLTHHRAEIFYSLRADNYKNNGYMSEALPKIIEFGFNTLQLHRMQAFIDAENIPSLKLLQKNNFKREGIAREDYLVNGIQEDSVCYSLLKWEF